MKYRSLFSFLGLFVLAAAIPLTIFIGEKQQDIRQRASGATISVDPSTQVAGGVVIVSWRGIGSPTANDWIGLYKQGEQDEAVNNSSTVPSDYKLYPSSCKHLPSGEIKGSGSCQFTLPANAANGTYELRLFNDRSFVKYAITTLTIHGSAVSSLTPTDIPTPTVIPSTPTNTIPSNSPQTSPTPLSLSPTDIPTSGNATLEVTVILSGLSGNTNVLHPQRQLTVSIFNAANEQLLQKTGDITLKNTNGTFTGIIDLGSQLPTGNYTIKVKTSQYLSRQIQGIQTITAGTTNHTITTTLIPGDINADNRIDILDYNILAACFGENTQKNACKNIPTSSLADLNDDNTIDGIDYNIFIRSLGTQIGE